MKRTKETVVLIRIEDTKAGSYFFITGDGYAEYRKAGDDAKPISVTVPKGLLASVRAMCEQWKDMMEARSQEESVFRGTEGRE